jgi:catechol 2,3-dioxygenase-like lactoylglutathione lyase family enzyme
MIIGAHTILYSNDVERDRAFLRDVLGFESVDAGDGWLIFAQPPAELAVHPADGAPKHELYFMCDGIEQTVAELRAGGAEFEGDITDQGWGRLITMKLPGGGGIGLYEPRHPMAIHIS